MGVRMLSNLIDEKVSHFIIDGYSEIWGEISFNW